MIGTRTPPNVLFARAHDLLRGRTLQRQSRHAEAGGPLRMAAAMGTAMGADR